MRGDHAGRINLPDVAFGDDGRVEGQKIEIARAVQRDGRWLPDLRLSRRAAIAGVTRLARARHRGDYSVGCDFANPVTELFGEIDGARSIQSSVTAIRFPSHFDYSIGVAGQAAERERSVGGYE
jgi:hypothetical protein